MTWDQEIDASGLLCPLPVLKARKRLQGMAPGQVLPLVATDPAAVMKIMKDTPINDFFAKNGRIREDGRMVHD
ncbi:MAG: sulfurtransferase TusA family protein, partial [Sphingomonadales bacterium]|nr:sulfurtransferase TusA family protein [Sphingomonadales bacterium]